jgi:AraC-like DNA-binding protein
MQRVAHAEPAPFESASLAGLLHADGVALSAATRESLAYIAAHYAERVRLADVAAASAQTRFQLIRAFRREVGTTPHAFVVRLRIAVAAARLDAGQPAASIAAEVGFVDQAHLTRHFKRLHGRTPARYAALRRADAAGDRYAAAAC